LKFVKRESPAQNKTQLPPQHPLIASSPKYKKLLEVQKRESITVMTYASLAPLTKLSDHSTPLHSVLNEIAEKEKGWSPATVLQKWASQHAKTDVDAIIASTSNKEDRLKEYLATFSSRKLTEDEVDQITKAGEKLPQSKFYLPNFLENAKY
jgi:diketogulonate reductase-like aldo/keto reductase